MAQDILTPLALTVVFEVTVNRVGRNIGDRQAKVIQQEFGIDCREKILVNEISDAEGTFSS